MEPDSWRNLIFFQGHLIAIFIWLIPSTWCAYNVLTNYHRVQLSSGRSREFRSRLRYAGPFVRTVPLDSVLKLFAIGSQFLMQFMLCVVWQVPCNFDTHVQHAVLYVAFVVSSLIELCTCYGLCDLPEGMDRLANVVAYVVLMVMFVFHNGHSSHLNGAMHSLVLPYACLAVVVALLAEGVQPTSFFVALVRPYSVMFFGLFFLQLGYTLFPVFPWQPALDGEDPRNLNIIPMLVCLHLVLALLSFVLINLLVLFRLRRPIWSHSYPLRHGKCEKCEPLLVDRGRPKRDYE